MSAIKNALLRVSYDRRMIQLLFVLTVLTVFLASGVAAEGAEATCQGTGIGGDPDEPFCITPD